MTVLSYYTPTNTNVYFTVKYINYQCDYFLIFNKQAYNICEEPSRIGTKFILSLLYSLIFNVTNLDKEKGYKKHTFLISLSLTLRKMFPVEPIRRFKYTGSSLQNGGVLNMI